MSTEIGLETRRVAVACRFLRQSRVVCRPEFLKVPERRVVATDLDEATTDQFVAVNHRHPESDDPSEPLVSRETPAQHSQRAVEIQEKVSGTPGVRIATGDCDPGPRGDVLVQANVSEAQVPGQPRVSRDVHFTLNIG